jgi:peptidoglycan/xylan/chitin deacetylase (PgdA/CDA1 family)
MSHDVDWRRQGASREHIIARKDRFDKDVIENLEYKNPYYNIPCYIDLEKEFGVRSTFFFRTLYEGGHYEDYEDDIRTLIHGGWEIGLHTDPLSINDTLKIQEEKIKLESLTKITIKANRVHWLGFNPELPTRLQKLKFIYDSSIRNSKTIIDKNEMGYYKYDNNLIEFPITLMDAYMFTYMRIKEDRIVKTFERTLNYGRNLLMYSNNNKKHFNIITVIWHDNVLKMKGGRMYKEILEYLISQDDVKIGRGIDLAEMICKNNANF